jgi:hypothetical protein
LQAERAGGRARDGCRLRKLPGRQNWADKTDRRTNGRTNGQAASDGSSKQIDMADEQTEGKGSIERE